MIMVLWESTIIIWICTKEYVSKGRNVNENDYIVNAFTREGDNTNLEVNNLNVGCVLLQKITNLNLIVMGI